MSENKRVKPHEHVENFMKRWGNFHKQVGENP